MQRRQGVVAGLYECCLLPRDEERHARRPPPRAPRLLTRLHHQLQAVRAVSRALPQRDETLQRRDARHADLSLEFNWHVALLLPLGLAAESIGCRPVILIGLVCREATRALLIFGDQTWQMALMQVAYGAA